MKTLTKYAFLIMTMASFPGWAGESIDKSLPINQANKVNIENLRGEVVILGGSGDEITVKGELDDKAEGFIFEQEGSQILIKVVMPKHLGHGSWNEKGSNLNITVPSQLKVNFDGVSSNITLSNFSQGVHIKTVSGDIKAKNLAESVNLSTVSGNIRSNKLSGKVNLSSVSGDIDDVSSSGALTIKAVSGDIESQSDASEVSANAVSGEIELQLNHVKELDVSTVSGNFSAELTLAENGFIEMSSVSGNLSLLLNDNIQSAFKLVSNAGGNIVNRLTNDKATKAKYGPSSQLHFTKGNGNASVKASTVSGNIKLSSH